MTAKESASAELSNVVTSLRGIIEAADDGVLITKETRDGEGVTARGAKEILYCAIRLLERQHAAIHKGVRFVKLVGAGEHLYALDERGRVFEHVCMAAGVAADDRLDTVYGWRRIPGDDDRDPRSRT